MASEQENALARLREAFPEPWKCHITDSSAVKNSDPVRKLRIVWVCCT